MKYVCAIFLLITIVFNSCIALTVDDYQSGDLFYPWDADAESASYRYHYSYPVVAGNSSAAEMINNTFAYEISYAEDFIVPMTGSMLDDSGTSSTRLTAEVSYLDENYFSVVITQKDNFAGEESLHISANVFALQGAKAGKVISLPYLLGVLDDGEEDTWLQERQTAKCDACVRSILWERIQLNEDGIPYDESLDEELFSMWFWPEEDFYLADNETLVFFFQPGAIAPSSLGVLEYRVSISDILDEL